MSTQARYIIGGGHGARERLRVLSGVMAPATRILLDKVGIRHGMRCLDMGCGGGDVARELAARAGPSGSVVGVDLDPVKIEIARSEAAAAGVANVEYRVADVRDGSLAGQFDLVFARFLLCHLADPAAACATLVRALRPGGTLVAVDIEFGASGYHPPRRALLRYHDLYTSTARARGGDPDIGPRLPALLEDAGLDDVRVSAWQGVGRSPDGAEGDLKRVAALTLAQIAGAVVDEGFAPADEVEELVGELHALARDTSTLIALPRIYEAWGVRPA